MTDLPDKTELSGEAGDVTDARFVNLALTDEELESFEHLMITVDEARKAKEKAPEGSKMESVADNVLRWAKKSLDVAHHSLQDDG